MTMQTIRCTKSNMVCVFAALVLINLACHQTALLVSAHDAWDDVAAKAAHLKETVNAAPCTGMRRHAQWHHKPCTQDGRNSLTEVAQALTTAAGGNIVSCSVDGTLQALPPGSYMIALNLHNVQEVLPHLIVQLIQVILSIDHGVHIFVSVYESGSTDYTVRLLHVLKDILLALRVPHRVLAGSPDSLWHFQSTGHPVQRIALLADFRNRALEPLWPIYQHKPEPIEFRYGGLSQSTDDVLQAVHRALLVDNNTHAELSSALGQNRDTRRHMLRGDEKKQYSSHGGRKNGRRWLSNNLQQHLLEEQQPRQQMQPQHQHDQEHVKQHSDHWSAGLHSATKSLHQQGMQLLEDRKPLPLEFPYHHSTLASLLHLPAMGFPADRIIFINDVYVCSHDIFRLAHHKADIACATDWVIEREKLRFYDTWVARTIDGNLPEYLLAENSFSAHNYTMERFRKGLPFPVHSCWNGMVVVDAKPFKNGLHARAHTEGECSSSECMLICDDFRRIGYTKILMDPGIRLVYTRNVWEAANDPAKNGNISVTIWEDVVNNPIDWSAATPPRTRKCCELSPYDNSNYANGWTTCVDWDPYKLNYTDVAIMSGFTGSQYSATFLKPSALD